MKLEDIEGMTNGKLPGAMRCLSNSFQLLFVAWSPQRSGTEDHGFGGGCSPRTRGHSVSLRIPSNRFETCAIIVCWLSYRKLNLKQITTGSLVCINLFVHLSCAFRLLQWRSQMMQLGKGLRSHGTEAFSLASPRNDHLYMLTFPNGGLESRARRSDVRI